MKTAGEGSGRDLAEERKLVKLGFPHLRSSKALHWLLEWSMKTFLSPNANLLTMRHFHLGSEILRFIADNTAGVDVRTIPLKPKSLDEIHDDVFLQHDLNLYNFVIDLNAQRKEGQGMSPARVSISAPSATRIRSLPRFRIG